MREGRVSAAQARRWRGGRRSNEDVGDQPASSLGGEASARPGGREPTSPGRTAELGPTDEWERCYAAAIRFLGPRPRSEYEVRERLARRGFQAAHVERALDKLRSLGLVDDAAFARYWVEQRQAHQPRGARMLRQELRQKGLDADVAVRALGGLGDEAEAAYRAALSRARTLRGLEPRLVRQRLFAFLQRRGFDYESTQSALRRLEQR